MLIRRAELAGTREARAVDLRLRGGRIAQVGEALDPIGDEPVLDAEGGAVVPGLHDHHIHLLALAAAADSVRCGPPDVCDERGLAAALAGARGGRGSWIRGIGYHESVAGPLDRARLDTWEPARPVRVQHRTGALWVLNSPALDALGLLEEGRAAPGLERDRDGGPTGRLYAGDEWLRARLRALHGEAAPPDLTEVGRRLARLGVTGLTDATPANAAGEMTLFAAAQASGALPQRLVLMGSAALPAAPVGADAERLARGARKIVLRDAALPSFDALRAEVDEAHAVGRAVAIHCVTRGELVFATAVLTACGVAAGDRIEHASVVPPELAAELAALGLTVVTQPHFVRERGDAYLRDVEPNDRPWLYRCAGLQAAGVPVGGGTDAPFGEADPWRAMQAAVDRRTEAGAVIGSDEAVSPEAALALFTSAPEQPGGAARPLAVGAPADLCVLARPWREARDRLDAALVRATLRGGELLWRADGA